MCHSDRSKFYSISFCIIKSLIFTCNFTRGINVTAIKRYYSICFFNECSVRRMNFVRKIYRTSTSVNNSFNAKFTSSFKNIRSSHSMNTNSCFRFIYIVMITTLSGTRSSSMNDMINIIIFDNGFDFCSV